MQTFVYKEARSAAEAASSGGRFLAGGTNLVDLMKLGVERPQSVTDINRLPLARIEPDPGGGLKIGALVRNSDLAHDPAVQQRYAALSEALLSGASPQLRNMATTAGNLLQRTRCYYFRDNAYNCNKREPGTGCSALDGFNRIHAVLGTSNKCIATHPSDMAVAMMALEAVVHMTGAKGDRNVPLVDFYRVPGETPQIETVLAEDELITAVTLPALPSGARSHYLKLRDRAQYEFALASAAVVTATSGGRLTHVRIALGGVGTKPWRSFEAEHTLQGKPATEANFRAAAEAALRGAKPHRDNAFKIELCRRAIVRALTVNTQSA